MRTPHHTASAVALVGGGSQPKPGEISLAHNGILFLDELPEFDRKVLEVLREPMESGHIHISRAAHQAEFPANFQLVAAMNPCPCGYLGDGSDRCYCSEEQIRRYRAKISGPLLDRIDMHIEVQNIEGNILPGKNQLKGESSHIVQDRIIQAFQRQDKRAGIQNSKMTNKQIELFCNLNRQQNELLQCAVKQLGFSTRAVYRILKVARTIADLEGSKSILNHHLTEAIAYRRLDRK